MPDDGKTESATWPMPKFRFEVDFGSQWTKIAFQEVSGMDKEVQPIEYRHSNSPQFSTVKMPGLVKYGNITMKRGVFVHDNKFWEWMTEIQMNTVLRRTVLIKLLDEGGKVTMQWQLLNAWPTKITGTDLKSDSNEVAVDTIEIAHEQMLVINA
ncbi:phage tail protein [Pseudomonas syringae]|uniref:Phage tail protein n=3 Tax=Pseudomonas syringae TaxID=317 RepID=A0A9Q4FIQ2_PSESX|nr:phage tail protein [Pseudomonas syringae pv. syringae PD2766]MCF5467839.1 phage tail protein [Pseudomonas syringae]MCF5472364.1 phage tail protein [Pseudomonas syringae]MCF5481658.1 phage tail protein [Pseudomonas syringae]MCF5488099.1 phage tail protein [Pseudomonas syringae]